MKSDSLPGIMFTAVGLIVLIAEVYNIRRLTTKKRRCTMRVQGQVVDCYPDALPLPIVEYTVNGVMYRVRGPEFKVFKNDRRGRGRNTQNGANSLDLFSSRQTGLEGATRETLPQSVTVYQPQVGYGDIPSIVGAVGDAELMKQRVSEVASRVSNPLLKLYPVGSAVDVYYDPSNPELAYVQRPLNVHTVDYVAIAIALLIGIAGVAMTVMSL